MFEVVDIPVKQRAPGAGVKTNPVYMEIVKAVAENPGKAILVPNEALPASMASKGKASIVKILKTKAEKAGVTPSLFHSRRTEGGIMVWARTTEDPFQAQT